jgi:hypothetical protein
MLVLMLVLLAFVFMLVLSLCLCLYGDGNLCFMCLYSLGDECGCGVGEHFKGV